MTKLSTILDQIDSGTVLLPEFQRGYVWNRDQVRGLMRSLYLGYPVGSLLVWETATEAAAIRGDTAASGTKLLLLDGQQRITSLYGVMRGRPPAFFEGDETAFKNLRFNVADETFEFYAPAKMRDDPRWIDVSQLFIEDLDPLITTLNADPEMQRDFALYVRRLSRLRALLDREFHEEKITGPNMTVDVVVDIFNRVNSGGTKLSKGDLALAKLCAQWPDARASMRGRLEKWKSAGYDFNLDWLLRSANAVATGRAPFHALDDVSAADFRDALDSATGYIGNFLDTVAGRLGLDHDRVLMGRYAFPVVVLFLHRNGGRFSTAAERDKVLFWYVHSALWGRYTGSTETVLTQDYEVLRKSGIDGLISALERWRGGNLTIDGHNFEGFGRGSRFYPLLYMLTRVRGACDLGTGLPLHSQMLGHLSSLQVHHIFPKSLLYKAGYQRSEVNAVANFCFLTQDTNLKIGNRPPEDYFAEVMDSHPGALASQWIPEDPQLWRLDRYLDFLAARRELLADAANSLLAELRSGTAAVAAPTLERVTVTAAEPDDARAAQIAALVRELSDLGYGEPRLDAEIADPETGAQLAVAEALWPDGLQAGQGKPVVLELDPEESDIPRLEELGYEVFTSVDALRGFARRRNEVAAGLREDLAGPADKSAAEPSAAPIDNDDEQLAAEFQRTLLRDCERARSEAGYNPTILLRMVSEHGGVGAAKRLLAAPHISDGFAKLWERGRLDLTVEAAVLRPEFAALFTEQELATARRWLDQFGYVAESA